MIKKILSFTIAAILLLCVFAYAESFAPRNVAGFGYNGKQWLSNETSRALLVCSAAQDYCTAKGYSFEQMAGLLCSESSYICADDELKVYIANGDTCIRITITFGAAAESASVSGCSRSEIESGSGAWYKVKPEHCRIVLAG